MIIFIGKCVVDLILVLIEVFSLGVTGEALRANIDWKSAFFCSNGVSLAQNFKYRWSSPTNHSSCRRSRWMCLSCGIRNSAEVSFVLSQFTRLTDGRTDISLLWLSLHCWSVWVLWLWRVVRVMYVDIIDCCYWLHLFTHASIIFSTLPYLTCRLAPCRLAESADLWMGCVNVTAVDK